MSRVLVVEEPKTTSSIRQALIDGGSTSSIDAAPPEAALDRLGEDDFEIMLVDVDQLPRSKEWLDIVRQQHPDLPIILVTADSPRPAGSVKALLLGAASFVPRNRISRDLAVTVERVVALCCPEEPAPVGIVLRESQHDYVLANNREEIVPLVRHIVAEFSRFELCRRPDRVRVAVAVEEALVNALVHGNLEIPSDLRDEVDSAYEEAIHRRCRQPPYDRRRVTVRATLGSETGRVVIRDEGPGFDPEAVPDPTDPENLAKPHGRGLLLMRAFMDEVRFNEIGNEVTLVKYRPDPEESETG